MKKIFTLFLFVLLTLCVSMLQAGNGKLPGKSKTNKSIQLPRRMKALANHQPGSNPVNSGVFKPAWISHSYWDDVNSLWTLNDSTRYTYNGGGNPTVAIQYDGTGSLSYRTTDTYNTSGKIIKEIKETWNGASWDSVYRETDTYNGSAQLTQYLFQIYNTTSLLWDNYYSYLYTYGAYGLTQELDQNWNGASWDNTNLYIYTYNGSGQIITDLTQNWNSGTTSWDNYEMENYSYASGQIKGDLISLWQNGQWVKNDSLVNVVWYQWAGYFSNDTKFGNYLVQAWDSMAQSWHDSSRVTYTYDAYANQTDYYVEDWDNGMGMWMPSDEIKNLITLDGNHNISQNIEQDWDVSSLSLINSERWDYGGYLFYSNVNDPDAKGGLVVFPNPSLNGEINLRLTDVNFNNGHLSVFNSIGEEVYAEDLRSGNDIVKTIPLHASAGIYYVKISAGEKEFSQKIILK